ncbi:MAG: AraC family transcriptional regulator [Bacteroidota bacterium]|nr:AraC family transcriptional regulator [Bacteroidota bacterium]
MKREEQFKDVVFATDSPGDFLAVGDDILFYENPAVHFRPGALPWRMKHLMFAVCRKGWIKGRIDMEEHKMEVDGFLLVQPMRFVEITEISPDFQATVFAFSRSFAESLNFGESFSDQLFFRQAPYHVMSAETKHIVNTYISCVKPLLAQDESFTYRMEIARLMTRAMVLSLASLSRQAPLLKAPNRQAHIVLDFVNLVADHYREHRDMDFYADRLCLTSKYITAIVKAQSGRSATDWIERYVILDAQSLLTSSDLTILQISQELHFPSQSFFGKYFKRVTGMSPKDYRRAARNFAL